MWKFISRKKISYFDKSIKSKLPKISKFNVANLKYVDVIFTALPNGEAQKISKSLLKHNTLIDIAADFRLNAKDYFKWYKKNIKHQKIFKKVFILYPSLIIKI